MFQVVFEVSTLEVHVALPGLLTEHVGIVHVLQLNQHALALVVPDVCRLRHVALHDAAPLRTAVLAPLVPATQRKLSRTRNT